ncbi:MAG: biotin transporter BioY [Candidatus Latescibacterota bacterium]|nr:biotin transporter BioY [Candidatus Latescibacterota bacterium]
MPEYKRPIQIAVGVGIMAALTAIGAFLRIPLPYVPITLQISFVYLSGILLGPKYGMFAQAIYVTTGLIGFPIFAEGGGLHYVLKPSFGYLLGFIFAAWISGTITKNHRSLLNLTTAAFVSLFAIYLPGIIWLFVAMNYFIGQPTTWFTVLTLGLSPLFKDLILLPINIYLGLKISNKLGRNY